MNFLRKGLTNGLSIWLLACVTLFNVAQAEAVHSFVFPVMSAQTSSRYGMRVHPIRGYSRMHRGIDLAAPIGTPIRSIAGGTVVFADPYAGYGNFIVVSHGDGITSHYGHCHKIRVKPGDRIEAGAIIGEVGSTGMSTGPHLHLEIRINGIAHNPEQYIPGLTESPQG